MKILRLSWQNIHSLRCKAPESIDLEAPPFLGNGLFTITGPTGAGKSTLLDVICLALYGRTPRFGDSASPAEHVMSWGTGECMAEVDYEIRGQRFRSRWQCHRARRKPEGSLQSPSMQVLRIDVSPVQTLHTLSRDVLLFNEAQVGLKFEHFRRAILLAQGQFAEFLKGKGENRRDILERLTDTRIYVELSRAVYRRADALAQGLAELRRQKAEAEGRVLPPDALAELESGIAQVVATLAALGEARTSLALERHRLDELDRLDREAEAAQADAAALDTQLAERSADWAALARHDALAPLAEVLANHARDAAAQMRLRGEIEVDRGASACARGSGRHGRGGCRRADDRAGGAPRETHGAGAHLGQGSEARRTARGPPGGVPQAPDGAGRRAHRGDRRRDRVRSGAVRAESTAQRDAAQAWLTENAGTRRWPSASAGWPRSGRTPRPRSK